MLNYPLQIIIIDDDPEMDTREVFFQLAKEYGKANIIWKQDPNEGVEYVKNNLNKRTVVILDYSFRNFNNNICMESFQQIQTISSLLYIILYTSKSVSTIPDSELKEFVNNHLMGLCFKLGDGSDYPELLKQVEKGFEHLSRGVDCALEEWILSLDEEERAEKNIITRGGTAWSLEDLLYKIRQRTPEGIDAEKNIITLSLDLINRGKRPLNV